MVERMAECYNIACPYCVDYSCKRTATCDMRLDGEYVKVKHGRWEETTTEDPCYYRCSECGRQTDDEYNYCPNCGARMDEVTE